MKNIRKRRNKYYHRTRWYDEFNVQQEKEIPLYTASKTEAYKRGSMVERYRSDIIKGLEFDFPWQKKYGGRITLKEDSLSEAVDSWIERRKKRPDIRPKTIEINLNSINHLYRCLGKNIPLKSITTNQMDDFNDYLLNKGFSNTTVNIHSRTVKTFFRYCFERRMIDNLPKIDQIKVEDSLPIYITDNEYQSVIDTAGPDSFYGRVFHFYRETGLRLREPFIATLDGNWLDIPNTSKGKRPRAIELNKSLVGVFNELRRWANECGLVERSKGVHLSKMFKKALRKCGIDESKHFHSLRHTYAVRRRVMGFPLAAIQLEMGHRSIATTEIYTKLELKRLRHDFPTLVSSFSDNHNKEVLKPKYAKRDTDLRDTSINYGMFIEDDVMN